MKTEAIFFGGSKYVIPILQVLHPKLVVTTEKDSSSPVIQFCKENNIPYLSVTTLSDESVKQRLNETKTDVAVLADFGLILPKSVLSLYPKGIVNIHPSLLPKYRGPTPGPDTILQGDTQTGVTLIRLDEQVDHGPIIAQRNKTINSDYTSDRLYTDLFSEGAALLEEHLDRYMEGQIQPMEQDHSQATFTQKLTRQSGYFDSTNPPAPEMLKRMIRAYYPWPGVWTKWEMESGKWKIIKLLPDNKIQVEGKKPMTYKDFKNGYPQLKQQIEKFLG